jgi:hypothetical protein
VFDLDIYCETLFSSGNIFPVEPLNTYSNFAALIMGVIAYLWASRSESNSLWVKFPFVMLISNGLTSFLWHGTRQEIMLVLDVITGLLVFISLFVLWARYVLRGRHSVVFIMGFLISCALGELFVHAAFDFQNDWLSLLPSTVLFGSYLVYKTASINRRAGYFGIVGIVSAAMAVYFRTFDSYAVENGACIGAGGGTHHLWHIILAFAAFMGVFVILGVSAGGKGVAESRLPLSEARGLPRWSMK